MRKQMKKIITTLLIIIVFLYGCENNETNRSEKKEAESISDTVDSTKENIQETSEEAESTEGDNEIITLTDGVEGEYGQNDLFDGEPYLRYHVPVGSYKVKCNIRGGFYIETIELHKEDGWDAPTTIQQINMSEGEEVDISIEDGQCISLIINTEIELIKQ